MEYDWFSLNDLPNERWRDIIDFEGLYQISDYGRVKSNYSHKILKHSVDARGYTRVTLVRDGKLKYYRINRLVATAFVENPLNKKLVLHKKPVDKDYCNNHYSNLYWGDETDNNQDTVIQRRGNGFPVNQYTLDEKLINTYNSCREAGRKTGLKHEYIAECCRGKRDNYSGYIWKYEEV